MADKTSTRFELLEQWGAENIPKVKAHRLQIPSFKITTDTNHYLIKY